MLKIYVTAYYLKVEEFGTDMVKYGPPKISDKAKWQV